MLDRGYIPPTPPPPTCSPPNPPLPAIAFLEKLMFDFLAQLEASTNQCCRDEPPSTRKSQNGKQEPNTLFAGIRMALANRKTGNLQELVFPHAHRPSKTAAVLLHMTRILFVASVLYEAILTKTHVTKRDLYYRNVSLFGTQSCVDKVIDDLACTAGLKRQNFFVRATSKGLVASKALSVHLTDGGELPLSSSHSTLIPPQEAISHLDAVDGHLDWVLIVEKDAIMQSLCSAHLLDDDRLGPGVIITGKGYPDLASLQLLRRIADTFPQARMYALVDADPHGIDILSVYTFGSAKNAHSPDYGGLPLGNRLQWIGVKASELSSLGRYESLIPLGERDVQLAIKMCTSRPDMPSEWKCELAHMIHLHRKAEIQILHSSPRNGIQLARALNGSESMEMEVLQDMDVDMEADGVDGEAESNRLVEYIVERVRPKS